MEKRMNKKLAKTIITLVHKAITPSIIVTSHGEGLLISDVVSHYNKSFAILENGMIEVLNTQTHKHKHYKFENLHKAIANLHKINP